MDFGRFFELAALSSLQTPKSDDREIAADTVLCYWKCWGGGPMVERLEMRPCARVFARLLLQPLTT